MKPGELDRFETDLKKFAGSNKKLVEAWQAGVRQDSEDRQFSYFFLDKPLVLENPLMKEKNSNSAGWIGSNIPKNRTVDFVEFLRRVQMARGKPAA